MRAALATVAVAASLAIAARGVAYPLDGFADTGIARLEAYRLAQDGQLQGQVLPWGAQLYGKEIGLRLADAPASEVPPPDPELSARIVELLGADADRYGIAFIDVSDPARPRYAAHNADQLQNPGSVGKIVVALAWFQALADAYPDDVEARKRILRETRLTADAFIRNDEHLVPFFTPGDAAYVKRPIEEGDTANLWTWLDWMLSSSSNAAAAELQAELVVLAHFRERYPVPPDEREQFLRQTSPATLGRIYADATARALVRNGLRPTQLKQGTIFTREGKRRISGDSNHASAHELLHYMLLMEQGRLVDRWSSLELKKLLYLTDARIRYASAPVLRDWAVYFKSGSFYSCRPEPGFTCEKYAGNRLNYMNSIAMVENVDQKAKVHYIAAVLSNVLRTNSEDVHRAVAERLHEFAVSIHPERDVQSPAAATAGEAPPPSEEAQPAPEPKQKRSWWRRLIGGSE
jgi:hypothetical protein